MNKVAEIETLDGETRPASKEKTLKETFAPATEKRQAEEKKKGSLGVASKTNHKPQNPGPNHVPVQSTYIEHPKDGEPAEKATKTKAAPKPKKADDDQKIHIKNKENPHAEGSKRGKHWEKVLKCKTTSEFKDKGGRMNLLPVWEKSGHITLG